MLLGRRSERRLLDRLLENVRAGQSGALVITGEPGVGKTALLDYVRDAADGCRIVRATGVESEMELAFAGLHQLCAPMFYRLDRLPRPQHDALGTAFGLQAGDPPDRFMLGLAVLSLLSEVAHEQPLVCLVDDAQWLDRASAQALAFAARRLLAESVGVVLAARTTSPELAGLDTLTLEGLDDADARTLLGSVVRGRLDARVRDRIVAETRGNPLALMELPRGLSPVELAGGFGLPDAPRIAGRIEESFRRRFEELPPDTRQLLLIAAAEPTGDPVPVWRAAERFGIAFQAAVPAADADLVEFGARVLFRHPLVRSAVYRTASPDDRRAVHRALAEITDPDLDRRAWHRAQAALGADEEVAAELERSAQRAEARGGLDTAAAFLERAAALTPAPALRAERTIAAARASVHAGAPEAALRLLSPVEAGPLDELQRARAGLLRAQIAFALRRGYDAPPLLLAAARRLEPLDPDLARETYLEALSAGLFVGRLGTDGGVLEAAAVARAAPARPGAPRPPRAADLLLDGLALLITEGYAAGTPTLRRAVDAFRTGSVTREEELRWLWLACRVALTLWDDESWHALSDRHVRLARDAGALTILPAALSTRIAVHLNDGDFGAAASLTDEQRAVVEATGSQLVSYIALGLAAWRGREAEVTAMIEAGTKELLTGGQGRRSAIARWWSALLYNGLGRFEDALAAAREATGHPEERLLSTWVLPELIEAACRSGHPELAAGALDRLADTTRPSGSDWALGTEARARALLSEGDEAEALHREAIDRLGRSRSRSQLARAHLLYGEWLRGERRRHDAREQLRTAHEMLSAIGADGFAERASRELQATGERIRDRRSAAPRRLTEQEARVSALARDGLSNPEIGARLFISPRTVEYHLHKVFAKLEISSRGELGRVLADDGTAARLPDAIGAGPRG